MRVRHRLAWRIWGAVVASIALFAVVAGTLWHTTGDTRLRETERALAEVVGAVLPPPDAPDAAQRQALLHWRERIGAELGLHRADGARIASTQEGLPEPGSAWRGGAAVLPLPDGRVLVARRDRVGPRPGVLGLFALLAIAVAAGAWPVARRLTRRLEQLQASVERFGGGELSARVAVHGSDEVAQLAVSFNRAAERVEQLVQSHRSLLANASHELRSPLTRVRMAVELLRSADEQRQPALRQEVERGIGEIDALVDEILLTARIDAGALVLERQEVDLTALAAEACVPFNATLQAPGALPIIGDARLLRRLLRNLLDNARRYSNSAIDVEVTRRGSDVVLRVLDRGAGVPATERERIFEPFYRVPGSSEVAGGVGLGLALVRRIAEQHGGHVQCLPRDGGGACFEVLLAAG